MKTKLLVVVLLISIIVEAQITKTEAFTTGTKLSFYPNQCGNTIPEAAGKLTFCDRANNLGVVERSYGLNDRAVTSMLLNHHNQDEVYLTRNGLSIRNTDNTWENIPNMAIPLWGSTYLPTIQNGLVLPDGKIIIQAANSGYLFNVYDRNLKTFTQVNFPNNKYPQQVVYDTDRNLTWAFAVSGITTYLFAYNGTMLTEVSNLGNISVGGNSVALIYKNDHIYLGNSNGLYKIDVSNYTTTVPVIHYNSTTTFSLPFDKVSSLQFDTNNDLWMANNGSYDGSIVKFDITNETYDSYKTPRPDNPASNIKFNKLAMDDTDLIWAVGQNYSGLVKLTFTGNTPNWNLLPKTDLTTLGVPITYIPNHVYFRNNKFYFTTRDGSSGTNSNFEVIINDNDVWSGRNDDAEGNLSAKMNRRFTGNLPDANGGVWWFNRHDNIVVYRDSDDNHQSMSINLGSNNQAIDVDNKAIIKGGNPNEIRKIDFPNALSIQGTSNQATVIKQVGNQTWVYDRSIPKIDLYQNDNLVNTHTLDETDYQYCYYMAVDDDNNAWFVRYIGGNQLQIKKFDTTTATTTSFDRTENLGALKKIIAAPNNAIWIIGNKGVMYIENGNFYTFLAADYSEIYNIWGATIDSNGKLYVLNNDLASITTLENPKATTPTLTNLIIEKTNSILPSLDHYRPSTITIDSEGSVWTHASSNAFKLIDNDLATEYRRQSTLAVPVQTLISDILMYPNPTHHILNIKSKYPIEKVEIFSLLGKKVFEKTDATSLDLGNLTSGIYFVKISSNNTLISKKIVVK